MKKFEQLKKSVKAISSYLPIDLTDSMQVSALISDFDRSFELFWKTLKEYLFKELGVLTASTNSPITVIKLAYAENLLDEDPAWITMANDRNDDTHIYSETNAVLYASRIMHTYFMLIENEVTKLESLIPAESFNEVVIPEELFSIASINGVALDDLVVSVRAYYKLETVNEVFLQWDSIRDKVLQNLSNILFKEQKMNLF